MNKIVMMIGLCFFTICLTLQPYTFANHDLIHYENGENFRSFAINNIDLIIYNPYSKVDFNSTNYYKANLHTHTTESDGSSSPSEVIYHYQDIGGYNILAITDHNKNTWPWSNWISDQPLEHSDSSEYYPDLNMLAISGNEMSIGHHRGNLLNSYSHAGLFMRLTFWFIEKNNGLSIFYHPGRYNYDVGWYQKYFDNYDDCIIGFEVYNQGDRYSGDRILWDHINKERDPNNLIWGFSDDDMHDIISHAFRNYQHFLMDNLTEEDFRTSMIDGSFYFSYEPNGSDSGDPFYGKAMTPRLIDVAIQGNTIKIISDNADSFEWYNEDSQIIGMNNSINFSEIDSNFIRAVLINKYGSTYTQPFGIKMNVSSNSQPN